MKYITYCRFKGMAICGEINIPAMTECNSPGNVICYKGKPVCISTSENAHTYFMRNDDGNGMVRGDYITAIKLILKKSPDKWAKVWADSVCRKFRRPEHTAHWIWNHDFYNAEIKDLEYIYNMLQQK